MKKIIDGLICKKGWVSSTKFWNSLTIIIFLSIFVYLGVRKEIPEWLGWMCVFMTSPARLLDKLIDFRWGRQPPRDKE